MKAYDGIAFLSEMSGRNAKKIKKLFLRIRFSGFSAVQHVFLRAAFNADKSDISLRIFQGIT